MANRKNKNTIDQQEELAMKTHARTKKAKTKNKTRSKHEKKEVTEREIIENREKGVSERQAMEAYRKTRGPGGPTLTTYGEARIMTMMAIPTRLSIGKNAPCGVENLNSAQGERSEHEVCTMFPSGSCLGKWRNN